jgi:hypothetical protein
MFFALSIKNSSKPFQHLTFFIFHHCKKVIRRISKSSL